jgi:hypothetical protein
LVKFLIGGVHGKLPKNNLYEIVYTFFGPLLILRNNSATWNQLSWTNEQILVTLLIGGVNGKLPEK